MENNCVCSDCDKARLVGFTSKHEFEKALTMEKTVVIFGFALIAVGMLFAFTLLA